MIPELADPIPIVQTTPPDLLLGGDYRPYPSDWVRFPVQWGPKDYWFAGEHRNPSQANWERDASVGHSFDRYDNGTLSTVGWDDTGEDLDHDDLILEVAVVYRRSYVRPPVFPKSDAALDRFVRKDLPRYRSSDKLPPDMRTA